MDANVKVRMVQFLFVNRSDAICSALQSLPLCPLSCYSGIVNGGGESSDRGVGVIGPVIPWYGTSDPVKGKILCILSSRS